MSNNKMYNNNDTKTDHRVRFVTPNSLEKDIRFKSGRVLGNNVPGVFSVFPEQSLHKMIAYSSQPPQGTINQTEKFPTSTNLASAKHGSSYEAYTTPMIPANDSFASIISDVVVRRDPRQQMSYQLQAITTRMFKLLDEYDYQMTMSDWDDMNENPEEDEQEIKTNIADMVVDYIEHCTKRENVLHSLASWFSEYHVDLVGKDKFVAAQIYALKLQQGKHEKKARYKSKLQIQMAIQDAIEEVVKMDIPEEYQDGEKELLRKEFAKALQGQDPDVAFGLDRRTSKDPDALDRRTSKDPDMAFGLDRRTSKDSNGHEKGTVEFSIKAWKIAIADVKSLLRVTSELRFGDTLSYNEKIEEIMEIMQDQSVLYEQVVADYGDKKRRVVVANTAIENLSEQNSELNQELEVLDDELLSARNSIKALESRCSGVIAKMMNKSTEMPDEKMEALVDARTQTDDLEETEREQALDVFDEVIDVDKQEVLTSETLDDSGKSDEPVKVVITDFPPYGIGGADSQRRTSATSAGGRKGNGKKRTGHQKGLGRHSRMKKQFGPAEIPTLDIYMNQLLEKEHKLLLAEEEIEKLKAELERIKREKRRKQKMDKEGVDHLEGGEVKVRSHDRRHLAPKTSSVVEDVDKVIRTLRKRDLDVPMLVKNFFKSGFGDLSLVDDKSLVVLQISLKAACNNISTLMEHPTNGMTESQESRTELQRKLKKEQMRDEKRKQEQVKEDADHLEGGEVKIHSHEITDDLFRREVEEVEDITADLDRQRSSKEKSSDLFMGEVKDIMVDLEEERHLEKKSSDMSREEVKDVNDLEKERLLEEKHFDLFEEEVEDAMVDLEKERLVEEKPSSLFKEEREDGMVDLEKERPLEEKPSKEEVEDTMVDLEKHLEERPSDLSKEEVEDTMVDLEKKGSLQKKLSDLTREEVDLQKESSLLKMAFCDGEDAEKVMKTLKVPILSELVKRFKFGDSFTDNKTLAIMKTNLQTVCNIISKVMEDSTNAAESQGAADDKSFVVLPALFTKEMKKDKKKAPISTISRTWSHLDKYTDPTETTQDKNFLRLHLGDGFQEHINIVGLRSKDSFAGTGQSSVELNSITESMKTVSTKTSKLDWHNRGIPFDEADYWKVPITDIDSTTLTRHMMSHSLVSVPRTATPDEPLKHHRLALVKSFKKASLRNRRIEKLVDEVVSSPSGPSWLRSSMKLNPRTQKTHYEMATNPKPDANALREDAKFPPVGN